MRVCKAQRQLCRSASSFKILAYFLIIKVKKDPTVTMKTTNVNEEFHVLPQVVAGAHSLHPLLPESSKQIRKVSRMWQHEDFDKFNFTNDVSVLELDEPLEFNEFVKPLLLAEQGKGTIQNSFKFGFKFS